MTSEQFAAVEKWFQLNRLAKSLGPDSYTNEMAAEAFQKVLDLMDQTDADGQFLPDGRVPMPKSADEAAAMALVGEFWLRHNAPDRLKTPPEDVSPEPEIEPTTEPTEPDQKKKFLNMERVGKAGIALAILFGLGALASTVHTRHHTPDSE